MSQSRRHSVFEAVANVSIGYGIGLISQVLVFPAVGVQASWRQNVVISIAFTIISLARSYVLRRVFNRWHRA